LNKTYALILTLILASISSFAKEHPCLVLTAQGVKEIIDGPKLPLFEKGVLDARSTVDAAIAKGIDVPIPKDMAGGYTHEQHKRNYKHMSLAGALYQITKEEKYADYVKQTLLKYETIFPSLGKHPAEKSYSRGKLFWQCLNDANWLVYTAQAYDAVYNYLSKEERQKIEDNLLRPYANYISIENPKFFNRVHNHSTWGNAAVGMIGLAIDDNKLVQRALYGLPKSEKDDLAYDNDGGFIYENGQAKAGFFAQIDNAFSPDGYYEEGPYYQRYAMTPFMLFATALQNNRPKLDIFAHRDGVLLKAVYALIYQTNESGEFFPINDAQKGMSIGALSVISAVDIAYSLNNDNGLLGLAVIQDQVLLDQYGYKVAMGIAKGDISNTSKKSVQLGDGKDGKQGALTILRTDNGDNDLTLVFKSTGQGLGHGHFDKLGILLYSGSDEVLQDYGSARWVNMDQKQGGRYLPENKSWAKQSIAHNTLVVDRKSHFNGKYKNAVDAHSDPYYFNVRDLTFQVASASDTNAYDDVALHRTLFLVNDPSFGPPMLIDLFSARSDNEHDYELPFQYIDHYMASVPKIEAIPAAQIGEKHGYQHLYKEGEATITSDNFSFNWFKDKKFYSITGTSSEGDNLILARLGASDPNFNLRRDGLLIHQKTNQKNTIFLSVIESHGQYSPVSELPTNPYSQIKAVKILFQSDAYCIFEIEHKSGKTLQICFSKQDTKPTSNHSVNIKGVTYDWSGTYNKTIY
jgi:hypothetical protein